MQRKLHSLKRAAALSLVLVSLVSMAAEAQHTPSGTSAQDSGSFSKNNEHNGLPRQGNDTGGVLVANASPGNAQPGTIVGMVLDVTNMPIPGASVVLQGPDPDDSRTEIAQDSGYFGFQNVRPGTPYHLTIRAERFAEWTSPIFTLEAGEYKIVTDSKLRLAAVLTNITVQYTSEEIATQQVTLEEKQRVLGVIPNFYVVYDPDPQPLTTKLKFKLALRVARDPITAIGIATLAGAQQGGDTPNYGQGSQGYGKRFGADAADGFTDIMIGGALLPSLLHQDPRYFYKGTGSIKSRFLYAAAHPFVCKGDDQRWQPNYSSMGGDLASAALSNAYYPSSNRGPGLVFGNFAINTAERVVASLAQEFILARFTHKPAGTTK